MELRLKPAERNQYELRGILIKGSSVKSWLLELQRMQLDYRQVSLYPVPGSHANTLWACLVIFRQAQVPDTTLIGKNEWCQQLSSAFFIAERSQVFPAMTVPEMEQLFRDAVWFMHPEIGLVALTEELPLNRLLVLPEKSTSDPVPPMQSFIPSEIKSFQLAPVKPEDALQKLEDSFPKHQQLKDEPLSFFEKTKLSFYKALFTKPGNGKNSTHSEGSETPSEKSIFGNLVNSMIRPFMKGGKDFSDQVQPDLEELQRRNQKQIDKLLDMLKNNPEEALKYAIPLDQEGSSRGTNMGSLDLSQMRSDFSLFSASGRLGGRGSVDIGEHFHSLEKRYHETAEQLIRNGDFEKAAFVYMKLLKKPYLAAQTLEQGKLYGDAASIYLKFANNKQKAAECYEKGNLHANAIELYKELKNYERVGDLYGILNQKKEADKYYELTANQLIENNQYIVASSVYRVKMGDAPRARNLLLKGWRENKDGAGCLKVYFTQLPEPDKLGEELEQLYRYEVNQHNQLQFLQVLKSDSLKLPELEDQKREMAFEIIAGTIHQNPSLVKELHFFNPENKGLPKDTNRFVIGQSKSQRRNKKG